ncbi:purine-nucleoside phosphorylase [bacterium]|nr:purine-nucleoside phosphorylase [bacterium]
MTKELYLKSIYEAVGYLTKKVKDFPKIAVILGSGLGDYADTFEDKEVIPYSEIPNFPQSTVHGHSGNLVIGKVHGKRVVAMQGRVHFYEGYSMEEVTFPARVLSAMGVKTVVITNAAGGINKNFTHGDLMMIKDHINFMGTNPLIGQNLESFGVRFPDMTEVYSQKLRKKMKDVANKMNINIKEGVYIAMSGPSYETPAEIKMGSVLGADAVGMSTVPESIVFGHSGVDVVGVSCITNMAAGISKTKLSHQEVSDTANKVKDVFTNLIDNFLKAL